MKIRSWAKKMLIFIFISLVFMIAALTVRYRQSPLQPANVIDEVWGAVDTYYYDRTFNGYDWPAVRKHFLAKAPFIDPKHGEVDGLAREMLGLLGTSHAQYVPAWQVHRVDKRPRAGLLLSGLRDVSGMTVTDFGSTKVPRVVKATVGGFAYRAGVRAGDHVLISIEHADKNADRVHFDAIDRSGTSKDLAAIRRRKNGEGSPRYDESSNQIVVDHFDDQAMRKVLSLLSDHRSPSLRIDFLDLGIETSRIKAGYLPRVVDVLRNSPADKAGVEPGATVLEIHTDPRDPADPDRLVQHFSVEQPNGTRVNFHAVGERSRLKDSLDTRHSEIIDGALVLRFSDFNDESASWVREQIARNAGRPIVLDLRDNIGGLASSMADIVGNFLPPHTLIATQTEAKGMSRLSVPSAATPTGVNVAVLIGPVTASAAEVTASALKHYKRATVVGWPSAGEVVVARTYGLRGGGEVQVPFASLVDASGQELEGFGVTPDINLWNTLSDIRAGRDAPLACAINVVNGHPCR